MLFVLFAQLHNFGDLLRAKKLKAAEQKQVNLCRSSYCENKEYKAQQLTGRRGPLLQTLLKLSQGLKSLEKGYLLAKREDRAVRQREGDGSSFDSER